MNKEKITPILKGIIKHIPGVKRVLKNSRGGSTMVSKYCYTVWMRHLIHWNNFNEGIPVTVAELGPGGSLGTGLAALLSGSQKLFALDVHKYWDEQMNLQIFEELIELFRSKANIPDNIECPRVSPQLDDYSFRSNILSDDLLSETLAEDRLNAIRKEVVDPNNPNNRFIRCYIPWNDAEIINDNSVDFIYSQAVLEHVEDLDNTYRAMEKWLSPTGFMSHTIDFKSHGVSKSWNGHWTYNDLEWNIVRGGNEFLINRAPFSSHIEFHEKYGFKIIENIPVKKANHMKSRHFAQKFKGLSEVDITTSESYILSKKR